jgi:hypothetical protein
MTHLVHYNLLHSIVLKSTDWSKYTVVASNARKLWNLHQGLIL